MVSATIAILFANQHRIKSNFKDALKHVLAEQVFGLRKKLQEALILWVDGVFGNITEAALKDWETRQGLNRDRITGRKNYQALGLFPWINNF